MSTQASSFPSIPFSVTTPHRPFRLLELPADLLQLLTSDDKPETLDLKSSSPSRDQPGTKASSEYLHLCTDTKSWAVRQVSTSNSVYVTSPATSQSNADPSDSGYCITTISKPSSHLELIPITSSPTEIKAAISTLLPILASASPSPSLPLSLPFESLTTSLPYPTHLITPALRSLFAIATPPSGHAYIPSPGLLLSSWKLFIQHASTLSIDLSDPSRLGFEDIAKHVLLDEGSSGAGRIYFAIIQAIVEEFSDTMDQMEDGRQMMEQERKEFSTSRPLNAKQLTAFVGQLLVQCAGANGIEKQKLVDEWGKLVPLSWEKHCDVSALGPEYKVAEEDGKRLVWYASSASGKTGNATSTTPAATGKRKWHEKFAAQRNQT